MKAFVVSSMKTLIEMCIHVVFYGSAVTTAVCAVLLALKILGVNVTFVEPWKYVVAALMVLPSYYLVRKIREARKIVGQ